MNRKTTIKHILDIGSGGRKEYGDSTSRASGDLFVYYVIYAKIRHSISRSVNKCDHCVCYRYHKIQLRLHQFIIRVCIGIRSSTLSLRRIASLGRLLSCKGQDQKMASVRKPYPRATVKRMIKAHANKSVTKNVDAMVGYCSLSTILPGSSGDGCTVKTLMFVSSGTLIG